jgi:glycosyltransferase involved in cell wall biosynthesis
MKPGLSSFRGIVRLVILLRQFKPDAVHGWLYHGCLLSLFGARFAGAPHLVWGLRSANAELQGYPLMTRQVVRLCSKLSRFPKVIIVNSQAGRRAHQQLGYDTTRMKIIPNGIDVEHFHPDANARETVRQELSLASDALLVGMFARYSPMKDHHTFLGAVALVHARYPHIHFLLAGQGVDSKNQDLSLRLQESGLRDVVHLLGLRRDVPRLTAALDIACLSSWSESFPNVIAEAMSCGVPCVATNVGDIARIVGSVGRVVPARTPATFAEALLQLVEMSGAERQELGRRARQRICSEFSTRQAICLYGSIYENLRGYLGLEAARSVVS